jgi:hypothetical protein
MEHRLLRTTLVFGIISAALGDPAGAADMAVLHATRGPAVLHVLPFPRSERAQAVWESDACWRGCGAYTAWALAGCLRHDAQGFCLAQADTGDRACQRGCRTQGGPLLPLD